LMIETPLDYLGPDMYTISCIQNTVYKQQSQDLTLG
jgi:hypothetical protein